MYMYLLHYCTKVERAQKECSGEAASGRDRERNQVLT